MREWHCSSGAAWPGHCTLYAVRRNLLLRAGWRIRACADAHAAHANCSVKCVYVWEEVGARSGHAEGLGLACHAQMNIWHRHACLRTGRHVNPHQEKL